MMGVAYVLVNLKRQTHFIL